MNSTIADKQSLFQIPSWKSSLSTAAFTVAFCVLTVSVVNKMTKIDLNGFGVDNFSESNAYRAGQSYVEQGFFVEGSMPHTGYGNAYSEYGHLGATDDYNQVFKTKRYTHYPQLPDMLCGVSILMFGDQPIWPLRLIPSLSFLIAALVTCLYFRQAFGAGAGAVLALCLALTPTFTELANNLHYYSYVNSMMLLEMAAIHYWLTRANKRGLVLLSLVGFTHGWLSFDWCFIVVFMPFVFAPFVGSSKKWLGRTTLAVFVLGCGFTLAHIIHFAQVIVYFGSFSAAFDDFFHSAAFYDTDNRTKLQLFFDFADWHLGAYFMGQEFGFPKFNRHLLLGLLALALVRRQVRPSIRWICPKPKIALGFLVAFGLAFAWAVPMTRHGWIHRSFNHLHFMPVYLFVLVVLAKRVRAVDRYTRRLGSTPSTNPSSV